jgi:hypothetical protein
MNPYKPHKVASIKDTVVEEAVPEGTAKEETTVIEETVPDGAAKDVLAWVGEDKTRAQLALDTENARENPRKGVLTALKELLA